MLQYVFQKELAVISSIHWHGIRIDNAMDGVSGLTQAAVEPGQIFDYDFAVPDAGTYWFHAHNRSVEQVARGLYGALVVEERNAPDVDLDQVLVLDDWRLDPDTAQINTDFSATHDRSHAGRTGNYVATNGTANLALTVRPNQRLRLRVINAANARIFNLGLSGLKGWTIAEDGMPLEAIEDVDGSFLLAPGQRRDLIVDVEALAGEAAHLFRVDQEQAFTQVTFNVSGEEPIEPRPAPLPLPANPNMMIAGLGSGPQFQLKMEGGAMGALQAAILNGARTSFDDMAQANQFWSFNNVVGMTETPLARLERGQTARVEIINDTAFPHAMHLHGMHFREMLANGATGPLRDTLLMFAGETRSIAFGADNPGKWLFHCHMLSHAESGMMTWVEVA